MSDGQYTQRDLVTLLAPTLGEERALELVRSALEALHITDASFASQDAERALELIGRSEGFVGSVARFALARFTLKEAGASRLRRSSTTTLKAVPKSDSLARKEITSLLAPTLGDEKSEEVVLAALRQLGFPEDAFSPTQAIGVLDQLALTDGLVGVAARFAKAHFLMRAR